MHIIWLAAVQLGVITSFSGWMFGSITAFNRRYNPLNLLRFKTQLTVMSKLYDPYKRSTHSGWQTTLEFTLPIRISFSAPFFVDENLGSIPDTPIVGSCSHLRHLYTWIVAGSGYCGFPRVYSELRTLPAGQSLEEHEDLMRWGCIHEPLLI